MTTAAPAAGTGPAPRPAADRRTQRARRRRLDTLARWGFLGPALLYMLLFFGFPLVRNIVMSFQNYTTATFYTGDAPFAGLAKYRAVLESGVFGKALLNTLVFTAASLAGQFCIGLALALFFRRSFRLNGVLRSLLLLPWLVPLIVSGTVWKWILDQESGVLNDFLQAVGAIHQSVPWLASTSVALISVIIVNIWIGIPFNMVILYGGLQEIPAELYEAAALDGAGPWQSFRRITWPLLRPVTTVVLVLGVIYTVKVLDIVLVLTGGGPANSTETLGTQAYEWSFKQFDFGAGSVVGNVLIAISLVFALIYLRFNSSADTGSGKAKAGIRAVRGGSGSRSPKRQSSRTSEESAR